MSDTVASGDITTSPPAKFTAGRTDAIADETMQLPLAVRHGASLFMVALATGLALALERLVAAQNVSLFFVIPVVLSATMFGWGPSLAAVIAGVLAFDFFFTEPRYSFEIASSTDIWAAGLLLLTAAIVSAVAGEARRRADEARQAADRAEALRVLAHMVVEARPPGEIIQASATTLNRIFRAPIVILVEQGGSIITLASAGGPVISHADEAAAKEALMSRLPSRAYVYPFVDSKFDFWPVADRSGAHAVIGVDFARPGRGRPAAPERSVEVVAGYLAMAFRSETGA